MEDFQNKCWANRRLSKALIDHKLITPRYEGIFLCNTRFEYRQFSDSPPLLAADVSYFEDEDVGKVTFTKNINSNILDESNPKFIMCYESSDFCTGRNDCKCVIEQLADHFYNRAKDLKLLQSAGLVKAIVVESAGGGGGGRGGGDES